MNHGSGQNSSGRRFPGWVTYLALVPVVALIAGAVWAMLELALEEPDAAEASEARSEQKGAAEYSVEEIVARAREHLRGDNAERAERLLRSAIERFSQEQRLHFQLAEVLLQQEKTAEAYEHYQQAIFIGPDHAEYRHAAATVAAGMDKLEEASVHYSKAQKLDPTNPKYPLYRAQIQRQMGDLDEARASLVHATRIDPDLAKAWGTLAAIALEENNSRMALQYVEKARDLEPDAQVWRITEAKALRRLGRPRDAAQVLYAIPESDRMQSTAILRELALCHGSMSEPAKAADLYAQSARRLQDTDTPDQAAHFAYEAALWYERASENGKAVKFARMAASMGHEQAGGLADRLADDDSADG